MSNKDQESEENAEVKEKISEEEEDGEEGTYHGASCYMSILHDLEDAIEDSSWGNDIYQRSKRKCRIESALYKTDNEQELDSEFYKEIIKEEKSIFVSKLPLVQRSLKNVIDGVKLEGPYYLKYCPGDVIKHVAWCCNQLYFDKFGVSQDVGIPQCFKHIKPIAPSFKKIADPSIPVKKKRKILMNSQVGNGIFSVLANIILPILSGLLVANQN